MAKARLYSFHVTSSKVPQKQHSHQLVFSFLKLQEFKSLPREDPFRAPSAGKTLCGATINVDSKVWTWSPWMLLQRWGTKDGKRMWSSPALGRWSLKSCFFKDTCNYLYPRVQHWVSNVVWKYEGMRIPYAERKQWGVKYRLFKIIVRNMIDFWKIEVSLTCLQVMFADSVFGSSCYSYKWTIFGCVVHKSSPYNQDDSITKCHSQYVMEIVQWWIWGRNLIHHWRDCYFVSVFACNNHPREAGHNNIRYSCMNVCLCDVFANAGNQTLFAHCSL